MHVPRHEPEHFAIQRFRLAPAPQVVQRRRLLIKFLRAKLRHNYAILLPMRITVKLFAILRDRAGVSELDLELPAGSTVSAAAHLLIEQHAGLKQILPRAAFAVNREYVPPTTTLNDGDELAAIPPVSGG